MRCTMKKGSALRFARALALLLLVVLSKACNKYQGPTHMATQPEKHDLLLLLWEYPGYPIPGQTARCGLVFALWENGCIVRRVDCLGQTTSGPDTDSDWAYVEGRLDDSQFDQLRASLSSIDPPPKPMWVVVDAASERLYVRRGKEFITIAESLPPHRPSESRIEPVKKLVCSFDIVEPRLLPEPPDVRPP